EERFRGVIVDWQNIVRDGAAFPIPDQRDPQVTPPQELFVSAPDGTGDKQLTHLGLRPAGANWSADGLTLVFTADSSYRNERSYDKSDIWTVNVDGRLKKLTSDPAWDYSGARYSPDG